MSLSPAPRSRLRFFRWLLSVAALLLILLLARKALFPQWFPETLAMGQNSAVCVAFSPDGKTIAGAGGREERQVGTGFVDFGEVRFWDARTGRLLHSLNDFGAQITTLAYSPNGKTLATGTAFPEGRIALWDVPSGRLRRVLGHAGHMPSYPGMSVPPSTCYSVYSVAFSPDGKTVAAGYEAVPNGEVRLWDTATGAVRATLTGMMPDEGSVLFSPDGKTLAAVSADSLITQQKPRSEMTQADMHFVGSQILLFDAVTAKRRGILPGELVRSLAFSPDGKSMASVSVIYTDGANITGSNIRLVDLRTSKVLWEKTVPDDYLSTVIFSPDGQSLVTQGNGNTQTFWEARTGRLQRTLKGHDGSWYASSENVAFSPDGKWLAGCRGKQLSVWNAAALRSRRW